jgi:hypothetical protein
VPGPRRDDDLAVLGADHQPLVAELEPRPTLDHRPALRLTWMQVRGQPAAGLEPDVDDQVLAVGAALILFLSFTAMASGPDTQVKMMATGLAAGILLDATVIRALIVPAVIALMGRWNWWLPAWPARLLRVEPSPLGRSAPRAEAPAQVG